MAHKCTTCDRMIANHRKYTRCRYCKMGEPKFKKPTPTDNTEWLDEILEEHCSYASHPKGYTCVECDPAKQAILTHIDTVCREAENRPVTIMGKTIDEIVVILSALELERIADMKMTMSKLDEWLKLLADDQRQAYDKAMKAALARFTNPPLNPNKDTPQ